MVVDCPVCKQTQTGAGSLIVHLVISHWAWLEGMHKAVTGGEEELKRFVDQIVDAL